MGKKCSTTAPREQFYLLLTQQNHDMHSRYAGVNFLNQKGSIDYLRAFYYELNNDNIMSQKQRHPEGYSSSSTLITQHLGFVQSLSCKIRYLYI